MDSSTFCVRAPLLLRRRRRRRRRRLLLLLLPTTTTTAAAKPGGWMSGLAGPRQTGRFAGGRAGRQTVCLIVSRVCLAAAAALFVAGQTGGAGNGAVIA